MEFRICGEGGPCCISQASRWDPWNMPSENGDLGVTWESLLIVLRIESRTLHKLGEHSTTQPCPSPSRRDFKEVFTEPHTQPFKNWGILGGFSIAELHPWLPLCLFEIESCEVAQAGLEPVILLPQLFGSWNIRPTLPGLARFIADECKITLLSCISSHTEDKTCETSCF